VSIQRLIDEAAHLAGNPHPCSLPQGHRWEFTGARACSDCDGEQSVYQCSRCGQFDYGERGGPAWDECQRGECDGARLAL